MTPPLTLFWLRTRHALENLSSWLDTGYTLDKRTQVFLEGSRAAETGSPMPGPVGRSRTLRQAWNLGHSQPRSTVQTTEEPFLAAKDGSESGVF